MGLVAVADSDLQIREGAVMHPDPEIRGGFLEIFFDLSGLSLVQK